MWGHASGITGTKYSNPLPQSGSKYSTECGLFNIPVYNIKLQADVMVSGTKVSALYKNKGKKETKD